MKAFKLILVWIVLVLGLSIETYATSQSLNTDGIKINKDILKLNYQNNIYSIFVSTNCIDYELLKNPQKCVKNIEIRKNGQNINANKDIKKILYENLIYLYNSRESGYDIGNYYDGNNNIFRPECKTINCGYALIGFDNNDRKLIYKEIIKDMLFNLSKPGYRPIMYKKMGMIMHM